jgi:hypothetical protein
MKIGNSVPLQYSIEEMPSILVTRYSPIVSRNGLANREEKVQGNLKSHLDPNLNFKIPLEYIS